MSVQAQQPFVAQPQQPVGGYINTAAQQPVVIQQQAQVGQPVTYVQSQPQVIPTQQTVVQQAPVYTSQPQVVQSTPVVYGQQPLVESYVQQGALTQDQPAYREGGPQVFVSRLLTVRAASAPSRTSAAPPSWTPTLLTPR